MASRRIELLATVERVERLAETASRGGLLLSDRVAFSRSALTLGAFTRSVLNPAKEVLEAFRELGHVQYAPESNNMHPEECDLLNWAISLLKGEMQDEARTA